MRRSQILRLTQENLLYIFDPKALQHVIVKVSSVLNRAMINILSPSQDQHIFQRSPSSIESVPISLRTHVL